MKKATTEGGSFLKKGPQAYSPVKDLKIALQVEPFYSNRTIIYCIFLAKT